MMEVTELRSNYEIERQNEELYENFLYRTKEERVSYLQESLIISQWMTSFSSLIVNICNRIMINRLSESFYEINFFSKAKVRGLRAMNKI